MSQCPECGKVYDESEGGCPYCGFMGGFRKIQVGSKKIKSIKRLCALHAINW